MKRFVPVLLFGILSLLFMTTPMEAQQKSNSQNIVTILEAHVDQAKWDVLRKAYAGLLAKLEPQIVRTVLVQSPNDSTLWRIMTTWRSREALDEYRKTAATPGGILAFRSAGAEPALSIFSVVEESK